MPLPRITEQTERVFRALLGAADASVGLYGIEIVREARLKSGTAMPILARWAEAGVLERHWEDQPEDAGRPRRRYYRLTSDGAEYIRHALATLDQRRPAGSALLELTPREAAALDRLLDAYVRTEEGDPGIEYLRSARLKVSRLAQDHAVYTGAVTLRA